MNRAPAFSHYDTLRVDRGASAEGVRSAYRRLAQKFHPDKHQGRPAAAVVMAQINQAYEVLSDPAQRSAYDEWLDSQDARSAAANAPVFTPDRLGWGGWLVFATASLAVLTVGYVVIATWQPAPGVGAAAPAAAQQRTPPVADAASAPGAVQQPSASRAAAIR